MTAETYPMAGYTDAGNTPHWVARLHPHTACCGQPVAYIPLVQDALDPAVVCLACRRSDVTPLPFDYDPSKDTA